MLQPHFGFNFDFRVLAPLLLLSLSVVTFASLPCPHTTTTSQSLCGSALQDSLCVTLQSGLKMISSLLKLTTVSFLALVIAASPSFTKSTSKLDLDKLPNARPHHSERKFVSRLVEEELDRVSDLIKDKALERIWRK
jgi:hypothetical protein